MMRWQRRLLDTRIANGAGNCSGGAYQCGPGTGGLDRFIWLDNSGAKYVAWEYDGGYWTQRETSPVDWQYSAQVAVDQSTGILYLVTYYAGLWSRSAAGTWTALATPSLPLTWQNRFWIAIDEARGELVLLYAPGDGIGLYTRVYSIAGNTWSGPFAGPASPAFSDIALAYDRTRGRVVSYGGWLGYTPPFASDEVFVWDGAAQTWTVQVVSGISQPAARYAAGLCSDPVRGGLLLFGGATRGTVSAWTSQTPVTDQIVTIVGDSISIYEPYCGFGTDPPNGDVGYWGRYPDQETGYALYDLAPAAMRTFNSVTGTKTIEVKITAYGGAGGPGSGRSKHRIGFATLDKESAYYLEYESAAVYVAKRVAGADNDDDEIVASATLSEEASPTHPVWLRLTLLPGTSLSAEFAEAEGVWTAISGIPGGIGSEFTPEQYLIALHTALQGFDWPDGSITYEDVLTDEDGAFSIFGGTWHLSDANVWTPLHSGIEPLFVDAGGDGGEVAKLSASNALFWHRTRGCFANWGGESANDRFYGDPPDAYSVSRFIEFLEEPPGPWPGQYCSVYGQSPYGPLTEFGNCLEEDILGPLVTPINPVNGQLNVGANSNIQLLVTDETGILPGSVIIEIAVDGGDFQEAFHQGVGFRSGWDGLESVVIETPTSLNIIIDPVLCFTYDSIVTVRVTAQDINGNTERF
jgi:hypothetical protein